MASQEQRQRLVLEFLTSGNPQAATDAVNKQTEAIQKLTAALENQQKTQQKNDSDHSQRVQKANEQASALDGMTEATYKLGMGAMYMNLPFTNFIAQSGNVLNGSGMMAQGFGDLVGALTPMAAALTVAGVAIGGIIVGMKAAVDATLSMTDAIRKLSEATSLSMGQTAREFSAFSSMFGGNAAQGIIGGIANSQANLNSFAMMQQQNAARAAGQMGPGQFYNPLLQGMARFGISEVNQNSSFFNPSFQDPEQVFIRIAQDIAARTNPAQRQVEQAAVAQQYDPDFSKAVNMLVTELQNAQANGQNPNDVIARMKANGSIGFSPTDQNNLDTVRFEESINEMETAWNRLKADMGGSILPGLTHFFNGLSDVLEHAPGSSPGSRPNDPTGDVMVGGGVLGAIGGGAVAGTVLGAGPWGTVVGAIVGAITGILGGSVVGSHLPHHASGGPVPAGQLSVVGEQGPELFVPSQPGAIIPNNDVSGFSGLLAMIPNIGNSVSQTLRDIGNQIDAIGGAAGMASRPLKDFIGDLGGLLTAWKAAGWVEMQQEVLLWGQTVVTEVTDAIHVITELQGKLKEGLATLPEISFRLGAVPAMPTIPDIVVNIVPRIAQEAYSAIFARGGPMNLLTEDRSMSVIPTMPEQMVEALVNSQPGPYWELTHDRSLSIIPTIDTSAVMAAINAIPTTINIGVKTVPVTTTTVADNVDRSGGGVTANAQAQVGAISGADWQAKIYNEAASVYAQTGVDPAIIATIGGTETGSSGKSAGDITLGIGTGAGAQFGGGDSGMIWGNGNTEGGRQPSGFFAYQNGAEAAQAFKAYIAKWQPNLLPLIGNAQAFFDPNGPLSTSNYYVPTATEAANAGGASVATNNYYQNWLNSAQGILSRVTGGVIGPTDTPPDQPDGTAQNPVAVTVVDTAGLGAGVSFGGGGTPPGGNDKDAVDNLLQKLKDGTVTAQDFIDAWSIGDPVINKLFQDIQQGQDPVQAMTNDLGQLGDIASMNLGDQLPAAADTATQAINQLGNAGLLDLGTGLPSATQDTINAFASMNTQAQQHFSQIESTLNTMTNTAVVGLGSDIPGASQDAGGSMTLLQAVTQDLKSKGLDPSNVSVGDLTDSLTSLGQGIPSLNGVIGTLINQLNAIPRDVTVNITTQGSASGSSGPPRGDTSPGSSGPGGRNNNIPAPGQSLNGTEPGPSASPPSAGGGGEPGGSISSGGGGGGGHVLVMAEGGILNEPVMGVGMFSGDSYLMGEAGPEAVVPLNSRKGGASVNITVNVSAMDFSDPNLVRQMAQAVSNQIATNLRVITGLGRAL